MNIYGGYHPAKGPKQFSMDSDRNINSINGMNMIESTSIRSMNKPNFSLPSSNYVNRVLNNVGNNSNQSGNMGSNINGSSNISANNNVQGGNPGPASTGMVSNMMGFDAKSKMGGAPTNPNIYTSYQNPATNSVDAYLKYPALGGPGALGGTGTSTGGALGFANTTNRNALLNK